MLSTLRSALLLFFFVFGSASAYAETLLILPFENTSRRPEYNWIGEGFSELFADLLEIPGLRTINPDERNLAYERVGVPSTAILTRATVIKIAEKANADLVLIGSYSVRGDGRDASISITARLIDIREGRLVGNEYSRGGQLSDLQKILGELAWTLLYRRNAALPFSRDQIVSRATAVPPAAFESYMKARLTADRQDKVRFLNRAVREAKERYPQAVFYLGQVLYQDGDFEEAVKWLEKISPEDPNYPEAAFYLGVSRNNIGEVDKALASFSGLMQRLPLYEVYNNAAAMYVKKGQVAQALPLFKSAAETAVRDMDVQFNYGYVMWQAGNFQGAVEQLKKVVERRQADGEAQYILGKSLAKLGRNQESAAAIDKAKRYLNQFANWETTGKIPVLVRIKPQFNKSAYYQLRRGSAQTGAADASRLTPADEALMRARGYFLANRDQEAINELNKVLQSSPDNAEAHLMLGRIYERRADYPNAVNTLKAAIFWNPRLTAAHVLLGRIYTLQNNCDQAKAHLKKALEIDSKNTDALALKRIIEANCDKR